MAELYAIIMSKVVRFYFSKRCLKFITTTCLSFINKAIIYYKIEETSIVYDKKYHYENILCGSC